MGINPYVRLTFIYKRERTLLIREGLNKVQRRSICRIRQIVWETPLIKGWGRYLYALAASHAERVPGLFPDRVQTPVD